MWSLIMWFFRRILALISCVFLDLIFIIVFAVLTRCRAQVVVVGSNLSQFNVHGTLCMHGLWHGLSTFETEFIIARMTTQCRELTYGLARYQPHDADDIDGACLEINTSDESRFQV